MASGYSNTSRDLRQGDPLSPYLFIIMVEGLGKRIITTRIEGQWKGIKITLGIDPLTHQQFANDTILFGEASRGEAKSIKSILDNYSKASGKTINCGKSKFFFKMFSWVYN